MSVVRFGIYVEIGENGKIAMINKTKKNFRELYKKLVQSRWFKKTYDDKSVGEIIKVEE